MAVSGDSIPITPTGYCMPGEHAIAEEPGGFVGLKQTALVARAQFVARELRF